MCLRRRRRPPLSLEDVEAADIELTTRFGAAKVVLVLDTISAAAPQHHCPSSIKPLSHPRGGHIEATAANIVSTLRRSRMCSDGVKGSKGGRGPFVERLSTPLPRLF